MNQVLVFTIRSLIKDTILINKGKARKKYQYCKPTCLKS